MELHIPETIGTQGGIEFQFSLFLLARHYLTTGYVITGVNLRRLQLIVDHLESYLHIDLPPLSAGSMPKDFGRDVLNTYLQSEEPFICSKGEPMYKCIYLYNELYAKHFSLKYYDTPAANANELLMRFADLLQ